MYVILYSSVRNAGVAQLVEQLICNQQVGGSSPSTSSIQVHIFYVGVFPSGQRGQTVNLLSTTSVVRIHPLPPKITNRFCGWLFFCEKGVDSNHKSINRRFAEQTNAERSSGPSAPTKKNRLRKQTVFQLYSPYGELYCFAVIFGFQPSDIALRQLKRRI